MKKYISTHEVAPGHRVVMYRSDDRFYVESQQHISVTNGSLPWEFDKEGWRACTGSGYSSFFDAVSAFNSLADSLREFAHSRS